MPSPARLRLRLQLPLRGEREQGGGKREKLAQLGRHGGFAEPSGRECGFGSAGERRPHNCFSHKSAQLGGLRLRGAGSWGGGRHV